MLLLTLLTALAPTPATATAATPVSRLGEPGAIERAEKHFKSGEFPQVEELLKEHLRRESPDGKVYELLGRSLEELGRADEAAHYLDLAIAKYEAAGESRARMLRSNLGQTDPLAKRREAFLRSLSSELYETAVELRQEGQIERALEISERLLPIATPEEAEKVETLLEEIRAGFEKLRLDQAASEKPSGGEWPLVEHESEHYEFECNLEPDVVQRLASLMDAIWDFYAEVYFDGRFKSKRKATIRIHPTHEAMLAEAQSSSPGLGGWWSPGEWRVVCYDTRKRTGDLDEMLSTVFHEASHQFMELLAHGKPTPAWLNEGTASFFEGAQALGDGSVLWPDAAASRLSSLSSMLDTGKGPSVHDVLAYHEPSSYPGQYYPFGWGLVYFAQQFEDPETFEYVYRPVYRAYRKGILTKAANSFELFEKTFLGKKSPLGHTTFEEFEAEWKRWILEEIKPLHQGDPTERRTRRMAKIRQYLAAAEEARGDKKAAVGQKELLERALGHIEYVRRELDKEGEVDAELLLTQSDVLERLERESTLAPVYETILQAVDKKKLELGEERRAKIEARLAELDAQSSALRKAKKKRAGLVAKAQKLLAEYEAAEPALALRSYTFASLAGGALEERRELVPAADRLRKKVRKAGLLLGEIRSLLGTSSKHWVTIYSGTPADFNAGRKSVRIANTRPYGMINTAEFVSGEYEVRARVTQIGEKYLSSTWGMVFSGKPEDDWFIAGLTKDGDLGIWSVIVQPGKDAVRTKRVEQVSIKPPLGEDEPIRLAVHVFPDGKVTARVGEREPVKCRLKLDPGIARHAGIFVRDGETKLEEFVVERYPYAMTSPTRYAPEREFPPYAYLPGRDPHPARHPDGHSYGAPEPDFGYRDPAEWRANEEYLYGVDLYNHGYLWEAHEAWEGLWHPAKSDELLAEFLQGLIQCSAASLKIPMDQPRGLEKLARIGTGRLERVATEGSETYMGLCIPPFVEAFREFVASEPQDVDQRPRLTLEL